MAKKSGTSIKIYILILAAVLLAGGILWSTISDTGKDEANALPTFSVAKGPLKISTSLTGTIQAREQKILKSQVEGRGGVSIIYLIEEGSHVKKGDLLVELDSSDLQEDKISQDIEVQNAEASYIDARENLAVVKNQAQSDIDEAQLKYDFAELYLKKYIEGDYPNQLKRAESDIMLAQEEVSRAEETLKWSQKLFKDNFISQTELRSDELSLQQKQMDLELANDDLKLLENFTYSRTLEKLESDVRQAKLALERTILKAKADIVQTENTFDTKLSDFERQKVKLARIEDQIGKATIHAPTDGVVIYASSVESHGRKRVEPLAEGSTVRERQSIIYLPSSSGMNARVGIYEASLEKVHIGLKANIMVDALQNKVFTGHLASIDTLPDANASFLNPDLKIYNAEIELDDNEYIPLLRAGMNCMAEIIIEEHAEAIYVPIKSISYVEGAPTAYVAHGKDYEPRNLELGLDNNMMVHVLSGLKPGEDVMLVPPVSTSKEDIPDYEVLVEITAKPLTNKQKGSNGRKGRGNRRDSDKKDGSGKRQKGDRGDRGDRGDGGGGGRGDGGGGGRGEDDNGIY